MLVVSANAAGTFHNGDSPSRMFLCLKMGKRVSAISCLHLPLRRQGEKISNTAG